ncbi:hypothetical protein BDW22DRAFT_439219 [Trametopsis cervina]|nr:hypothetical protein BDW22DRAFT_439219 [Trametopsis cervina]
MFNFITLASLALSASVAVNGLVIPRHAVIARDINSYDQAHLEPYTQYNTRYMALGCNTKHQTQFFDLCCHPMLKGETLAKNREPQCDPANQATQTSASAAATPSDDGDDDGDCDDGDDETTTSATHVATSAAAPTTAAPAPVNPAPQPPKESTPAPSSSKAPTSKPAPKPSPTPKPSPAPAPPAAPPASGLNGHGTWFTQNGVAGACGKVHSDDDFIVALDARKYGNTGEQSPDCGRTLTITDTSSGKTHTATVADACPTCGSEDDLDMSVALFKALASDLGIGYIPITWSFN